MSRALPVLLTLSLLTTPLFAQSTSREEQAAPPPVPAANPLKTRDELQAAYQKEYAFLEAQVRDLQSRVAAFDAEATRAERDKEAAIDRIEGEYIDLQSRGERVNDLITEAERQVSAVEDSRTTLEATFLQAGSTLEPYGLEALRGEDYLSASAAEKIETLFAHTLELLGGLGRVRKEEGTFFLQDGTEVTGTLVRVGNIASYGVSGDAGDRPGAGRRRGTAGARHVPVRIQPERDRGKGRQNNPRCDQQRRHDRMDHRGARCAGRHPDHPACFLPALGQRQYRPCRTASRPVGQGRQAQGSSQGLQETQGRDRPGGRVSSTQSRQGPHPH